MVDLVGLFFGVFNMVGGLSKGFFWMSYDYVCVYLYEVIYNSDWLYYWLCLYVVVCLEFVVCMSGRFYVGIGFFDWGDF